MKLTNLWVRSPVLRIYIITMQHKETGKLETIKTWAKSRKDALVFGPKYMGKNYEVTNCKIDNIYDPEVRKIKRKYVKPNLEFLTKIKEQRKLAKLNKSK